MLSKVAYIESKNFCNKD